MTDCGQGITTGSGHGGPRFVSVTGPSGVGKSTVVRAVLARVPGAKRVVMLTDRARRVDEDPHDADPQFRFVTSDQIDRAIAKGELAAVDATWGTSRYVVSHASARALGPHEVGVLELGPVSIEQFRQYYTLTSVLVVAPTWQENRRRLRGRGGMSQADIDIRLARSAQHLDYADHYSYVCVNDDLERCIDEVAHIVAVEVVRAAQPGRIDLLRQRSRELSDMAWMASP